MSADGPRSRLHYVDHDNGDVVDTSRLVGRGDESHGAGLDAHRAATALTALIDGLWLEHALDPEAFGADQAEAVCLDYLDRLFQRETP